MKEILKDKKKLAIIIGAGVGVIVLIIVLLLCFGGKLNVTEEQKLEEKLQELGKGFYEDFYYKQVASDEEARTEFLKKYKDLGIKVNLDTLSRYKKEADSAKVLEPFVNSKTKEECDKINTMVIVYPKEPYGQKDYRVDVKLVCGFEKEKDEK